MAIAFDASSTKTDLTQPSSVTSAHTVTGANTYLIVEVGLTSGAIGNVTGVTYNGVAMTSLNNVNPVGHGLRGTFWGLKNPATGTHNIVASISGANDGVTVTGSSYTGVDQTTPIGVVAAADSGAGTSASASISVASAVGDVVVGGIIIGNAATSITIGAGQTQRAAANLIVSNGEHDNRISDEPGAAGTTTHSWTWTGATDWTIAGVALKPAGAATAPAGSQSAENKNTTRPYPTQTRTWTSSYNQNLIGKDAMPPGRKGAVFDLAPRSPLPAGATWTWAYNPNLVGKDVFPPGRKPAIYDEVQPVSWRRDWTQNLLLSTLVTADQTPFNQTNWPLPQRTVQPDRTWISSALQLLLPPVNGIYVSQPQGISWRSGWTQNLLQSTLTPVEAVPFAQYDWPVPQRASQPDRTWTSYFNPNLVGQDVFPPGVVRSDRSLPVSWQNGWTQNLLLSTLAVSVQMPLNQYHWPAPGQPWQPTRGWASAYNVNLIGQDQLPFRQTDWPLPQRPFYPASVRASQPLNPNLFPPPPPPIVLGELRNPPVIGVSPGQMGTWGTW